MACLSESLCFLLGYTPHELDAAPLLTLAGSDGKSGVWAAIAHGTEVNNEAVSVRNRDGRSSPMRATATVLADRAADSRQGMVVLTEEAQAAHGFTVETSRRRPARELAYAVTIAAGRERERLANELHDGLGQLLAIAQIRVDELDACMDGEARCQLIEDLRGLLGEASRATHAATFDLHSPVLGQLGLQQALLGLGERMARLGRFEFELHGNVGPLPLPLPVQAVVLRVVRELLANACKHAHAGHVAVRVDAGEHALAVEVVDDGCGHDAARHAQRSAGGFGLMSIAAQIEAVGGRLEISSVPGRGTRAIVSLPYADALRRPRLPHWRTVRAPRRERQA